MTLSTSKIILLTQDSNCNYDVQRSGQGLGVEIDQHGPLDVQARVPLFKAYGVQK